MGDDGGGSLISPDGVAPSRMVDVSASVNLPLHHKVQKSSLLASAHPGGPVKRAVNGCGCVCASVLLKLLQFRQEFPEVNLGFPEQVFRAGRPSCCH